MGLQRLQCGIHAGLTPVTGHIMVQVGHHDLAPRRIIVSGQSGLQRAAKVLLLGQSGVKTRSPAALILDQGAVKDQHQRAAVHLPRPGLGRPGRAGLPGMAGVQGGKLRILP